MNTIKARIQPYNLYKRHIDRFITTFFVQKANEKAI